MYRYSAVITLLLFAIHLKAMDPGMQVGTPNIKAMSKLEFNSDGVLFIGDSEGGTVYAVDFKDNQGNSSTEAVSIADLEGEISAMLGTSTDNVLIHDMAVNPISQNVYLSVSRGRAKWTSKWYLPNDLDHATVLIKITPEGEFSEVRMENVAFSKIALPNPVAADKEHKWKKGTKLRVDAITDIAFHDGQVYIAGLSNEEFAAAMWTVPYPFQEGVRTSTLEIYHGAHGEYETHAPIRTFLPYDLNNTSHMLAAYLCTPLVTFETEQISKQGHIKGRTVAEFGSGNYPLDMVLYQNEGKDYILMSNSQLPLLIVDPADVESYEGEILTEVEGYLAGVKYTPRSGSGIQELSNLNEKYILATQRMPGGKLALVSLSKSRLRP